MRHERIIAVVCALLLSATTVHGQDVITSAETLALGIKTETVTNAITPARMGTVLEALIVSGTEGSLATNWVGNKAYHADQIVVQAGSLYRKLADGNSNAGFTPALWEPLSAGSVAVAVQDWAAATTYAQNEIVAQGNVIYRRNAAGTSGGAFVAANWTQLSDLSKYRGDWATGTGYAIGDVVSNGTSLYRATAAHTASATFAADSANWDALTGGLDKFDGTAPPTTSDDTADTSGNGAFGVGSHWVDTTNDAVYVAVDVTAGNAVWLKLGQVLPINVTTAATLTPGKYRLDASGGPFTVTLADIPGEWVFTDPNQTTNTNNVTIARSNPAHTFTDDTGAQQAQDYVIDIDSAHVTMWRTVDSGDHYIADNLLQVAGLLPTTPSNQDFLAGEQDTGRNWVDGKDVFTRTVQVTGATADVTLDLGTGPIQVVRATGFVTDDAGAGVTYQISSGGLVTVDPTELVLYWTQTAANRTAGDATLVVGGTDLTDNGGVNGYLIFEYIK